MTLFGIVMGLLLMSFVFRTQTAEAAVTPDEEKVLEYVDEHKDEILAQWKELVAIPGTSGDEKARVQWVTEEMSKLGLSDVKVDDMGNVIGTIVGDEQGPTVVFAAHMDTVFPLDTDLTVNIRDGWMHAPGSSDDTPAVIALFHTIKALKAAGVKHKANLVFVATVREETGLAGASHFLSSGDVPVDMFVAVDGGLGSVVCGALGIQWWRIKFRVQAHHTLRSKGKPNAAAALSSLIQRLYTIEVPEEPMTVYNVGTIKGGSATNAVCAEAELTIDLRSQSAEELSKLVNRVLGEAHLVASEFGAEVELTRFNNIEAGVLPGAENHTLTQTAVEVLHDLRMEPKISLLGATDANPAIVRGIPGIAVGCVEGQNAHSVLESARIESMYDGVKQVILLAMRLGN